MGKDAPSLPPPPDPAAVTAAQTASNAETARTQARLNRFNVNNPFYSTNWTDLGDDRWEQTTNLHPQDQARLDQTRELSSDLSDLALDQTGRISGALSTPLDYEGLTPGVSTLPIPQLHRGAPDLMAAGFDRYQSGAGGMSTMGPESLAAPTINMGKTGVSADGVPQYGDLERSRVEEAIYARLNPQFDRDRARMETALANRGITRGSEAWNAEVDAHNRALTDARTQAVLAGGQEQSRLFGLDLSSQEAKNRALMNQFNLNTSAANFQNAGRGREFAERAGVRNAPLQELALLLGTAGGQPGVPPPQQAPVGVQPVDVQSPINTQYAAQLQQAQMNNQNRQGAMGGLFGLLGQGLGGWASTGFA